jgi:metallopeptidase MepB
MVPQAYKKPPQAPPVFTGSPKSIVEDTRRMIEKSRSLEDTIVAEIEAQDASFRDVLLPIALDENDSGLISHIIGFYQSVSTDQAVRDASTKAEQLMDDFSIESSMREDVYKLVEEVTKKNEKLDAESQRLLEKTHKHYIRHGLGIPAGPKRDRYKEIKKRLSQLCIIFSKNLNEEVGGIWFDRKELEGVPEDVMSLFAKGESENAGKVRMTFKYPDVFPTLKYAKNPATRKRVYLANENKLPQNIPIFREVILLRDEAARLLGYPNHASFIIEDKMAKTPKTVDDFLGDLRQRLKKGGESERKALTDLKEQDLKSRGMEKSIDGRYYIWDNRFYDRLMLEKHYSVDQELISEWFPLETSIRGMLTIFEKLFGMTFVEITGADRASISPSGKGDDIVWHPDVQVFSVWDSEDQGSGFVGYLYLDLHPREGKYGHAANFNLQPGFIQENGTRRYPVTALVCNFSKPTAKKPSLLKHDEVTTLFHELGHGIHDLVSKTHYSRFHGTNVVRDFVEAPSQMLENWCWTPSQLKALSHHYSTLSSEYKAAWREQAGQEAQEPEEKIPDELIKNLIKTKHVNDSLFNLRQLHFGIFDMTIHEPKSHEQVEGFKFSEMYNKLGYELTGLQTPAQLGESYEWGTH